MICADTNCWIPYLDGVRGGEIERLARAIAERDVAMAPVILAELFSSPVLEPEVGRILRSLPFLQTTPGFWERAGQLRARLRLLGYRPKLADTMIAQSCIDYGVPLLTRDRDFRPFARHAGLRLAA